MEELPPDMQGNTSNNCLFNKKLEIKNLSNKQGQLLHHLVAKLLYLSKCTRQDIQTAIAFLCTRVQELKTDDSKKLFFKKPLQGSVFKKVWNTMLNINMPDTKKNR